MNRILTLILISLTLFCSNDIAGQRIQQPLGRGVVAVRNGSNVLVSWRKLAQEPEDATYNVYYRSIGSSGYTKLNSDPLSLTNMSTTTSKLPVNSEVAVALVNGSIEEEKSAPFIFKNHELRGVFFEINYDTTILPTDKYTTKYVWPADLTGDGEYDFIVDRLATADGLTDKIEGYARDGKHLWTVDLGPNVKISRGHNDMVVAYDIDCDGKAEVIIKSSDGTRFWDADNKQWGEYLLGKEDTDGDGIIDYENQNVKNPPQYITVIDGMTGKEKSTIEMPFPSDGSDTYKRNNKANYMDTEYSKLNGHMGICYLDGIHPSVTMEYMVRDINKTHHYYVSAWGYDFSSGNAGTWKEHFTWSRNDKNPWPAEFHHIRIGDVSLDGRDEILDGGFAVKYDGTMLFSAGISHGDRFRVGDIDPDRPGLETFAIQQNAGDMLGQILYDAATGEPIKKWYMGSVGDVGRGECMDIDPNHKGYEMWSTMGNLYNAKGELIKEGAINSELPFPTEGVWWDGELDREYVSSPDGNGYNPDVRKYNNGSGGNRLIEIGKLSGYTITSEYGKRAMYWGDIIGDWREELIFRRGNTTSCTGIVGFTTDFATKIDDIYCLQEDPNYRMQCTTRGYYQSAIPGFYLGYDMPRPPLPPCMVTDLVWGKGSEWNSGSQNFSNYQRNETAVYADGKSVLFDLAGNSEVNISSEIQPSVVYAMPPKGKTYNWNGEGSLNGKMDLWKSQNGVLSVNIPLNNTGTTYISEGILELNNILTGPLSIRAKGTLSGTGTVKDSVIFEGALNYEGCRIKPGTEKEPFGKLEFKKTLNINKEVYLELDLRTGSNAQCDYIITDGDLNIGGSLIVNFKCDEEKPEAGKYRIIEYKKEFTGDIENIKVSGLSGISYNIINEDNAIYLNINSQRSPSNEVFWNGGVNSVLDFQTENLLLNGTNTSFVALDELFFGDDAEKVSVVINDDIPSSGIRFINEKKNYTVSGNGAFSGSAGLTKEGSGSVFMKATKNTYTGATVINGGSITVDELADGGLPSSIGAASGDAGNLQIGDAVLIVNNSNAATNRGITLNDNATIRIPSGITSLKGIIKGKGTLVKEGSGQLNITYDGTNTWSGGTILRSGTLAMGTYRSTFGAVGSKILAEGGTIQVFDNNSTSAIPAFNHQLEIAEGKSLRFNTGSRCHIKGSWTGSGTVTINFPYVRADFQTEMKDFEGKIIATGSQFRLNQAIDMSKAVLELSDGVYMAHMTSGSGNENNLTTKIGGITGNSTTCSFGTGTYKIGYLGNDDSFAGTFGSNATLHKYGEGSLTLTGASSCSVTVYEGTLITKNISSPITTGTITISSGGTLSGKGHVSSVTVNQGGTLKTKLNDYSISNMTIKGNCNVKRGAIIDIRCKSGYNDYFNVTGNLTMASPEIRMSLISGSWSAGDEYQVFNVDGNISLSGEPVFEPSSPAEGLEWDYSDLQEKGILKVKVATSINEVKADKEEEVIYDILGRKVSKAKKGFYIINNKKQVVE